MKNHKFPNCEIFIPILFFCFPYNNTVLPSPKKTLKQLKIETEILKQDYLKRLIEEVENER